MPRVTATPDTEHAARVMRELIIAALSDSDHYPPDATFHRLRSVKGEGAAAFHVTTAGQTFTVRVSPCDY